MLTRTESIKKISRRNIWRVAISMRKIYHKRKSISYKGSWSFPRGLFSKWGLEVRWSGWVAWIWFWRWCRIHLYWQVMSLSGGEQENVTNVCFGVSHCQRMLQLDFIRCQWYIIMMVEEFWNRIKDRKQQRSCTWGNSNFYVNFFHQLYSINNGRKKITKKWALAPCEKPQ